MTPKQRKQLEPLFKFLGSTDLVLSYRVQYQKPNDNFDPETLQALKDLKADYHGNLDDKQALVALKENYSKIITICAPLKNFIQNFADGQPDDALETEFNELSKELKNLSKSAQKTLLNRIQFNGGTQSNNLIQTIDCFKKSDDFHQFLLNLNQLITALDAPSSSDPISQSSVEKSTATHPIAPVAAHTITPTTLDKTQQTSPQSHPHAPSPHSLFFRDPPPAQATLHIKNSINSKIVETTLSIDEFKKNLMEKSTDFLIETSSENTKEMTILHQGKMLGTMSMNTDSQSIEAQFDHNQIIHEDNKKAITDILDTQFNNFSEPLATITMLCKTAEDLDKVMALAELLAGSNSIHTLKFDLNLSHFDDHALTSQQTDFLDLMKQEKKLWTKDECQRLFPPSLSNDGRSAPQPY